MLDYKVKNVYQVCIVGPMHWNLKSLSFTRNFFNEKNFEEVSRERENFGKDFTPKWITLGNP